MGVLRRLGSKAAVMKDLLPHFPDHTAYVESFFGAGGSYFNKPKARFNCVNDIDGDVYNFWCVIKERPEDFIREFRLMPVHQDLWNRWKVERPVDPVMAAVRFAFLSNFGFYGASDSLHGYVAGNSKSATLECVMADYEALESVLIFNCDFRKFLKGLVFRQDSERASTFIYNDPPYIATGAKYGADWTELDTKDLIEANIKTGCKFAVSEFDNPVILKLAAEYGLNVIVIGERQNMKNRRTEILLTNYKSNQLSLF